MNLTSQEDLYAVLGVASDATQEAILREFRRLAKRLHPDMPMPEGYTEENRRTQFERVVKAYRILGDPALRAKYDAGELEDRDLKGEQGANEVLNFLAGMLNSYIEKALAQGRVPRERPPMLAIREFIESLVSKFLAEKIQAEQAGEMVTDLLRGFEGNPVGNHLWIAMLRTRIREYGDTARKAAHNAETAQQMLELVEAMSFDYGALQVLVEPVQPTGSDAVTTAHRVGEIWGPYPAPGGLHRG